MRRRPVVVRGGRPGIIGTAARTAVVAGTAATVTGAVRRRQNDRAAEEAAAAAPAPTAAGPSDDAIAKLERLAELKKEGILTEQEFESAKAKLLGL